MKGRKWLVYARIHSFFFSIVGKTLELSALIKKCFLALFTTPTSGYGLIAAGFVHIMIEFETQIKENKGGST